MPDLDILIELADFYDVDIREIIDGERKSGNMDNETKDTLKKVAEYAAEEKKKMKNRLINLMAGSVILMLICSLLFGKETKGLLNGIVPEHICSNIMFFVIEFAFVAIVLYCLHLLGVFDKISEWKTRRGKNGANQ